MAGERKKIALITGINGQDGSYLAELLLSKGYEVHGTIRRASLELESKLKNLKNILSQIELHPCSIEDALTLHKLIARIKPTEIYHLAAFSFVSYDFDEEVSTFAVNFNATHHILSSVKESVPHARFYFAGSSEMFGHAVSSPQSEATPFYPRSIYGISKVAANQLAKIYREKYRLFSCTGITFNHESPRRGAEFVTRKITRGAAEISLGLKDKISLGNLEARRDWGYAPDYVEAMWKSLQAETPKDYVIATGKTHSVKEFLEAAFSYFNLNYEKYIKTDERLFRASEEVQLVGDASLIRKELGWTPKKDFVQMVREMVQSDLAELKARTPA